MVEIIDVQQNTPEWHQARLGLPTASKFSTVLAKGKTAGAVSLTRRSYLYELAGEIITGERVEGYKNDHMERGHAMEGEARNTYAFMNDVQPVQVGFVRNGKAGCSPDGLVGDDGGCEIKSKLPALLIEAHLRSDGSIPPEHVAQVQGSLWVCEREWWDFVAYWRRMPILVRRVYRDEAYIKNLASEVDRFNDELAQLVHTMRNIEGSTLLGDLQGSAAA